MSKPDAYTKEILEKVLSSKDLKDAFLQETRSTRLVGHQNCWLRIWHESSA